MRAVTQTHQALQKTRKMPSALLVLMLALVPRLSRQHSSLELRRGTVASSSRASISTIPC